MATDTNAGSYFCLPYSTDWDRPTFEAMTTPELVGWLANHGTGSAAGINMGQYAGCVVPKLPVMILLSRLSDHHKELAEWDQERVSKNFFIE